MLTLYATLDSSSDGSAAMRWLPPGVPVMLPASSWARVGLRAPRLPAHVAELAADCGGFVATFRWGDYRYTPAEYVRWLGTFRPAWAATMDYCCEDEITAGRAGIVAERQARTTEMARHFWREYKHAPWAWAPTVQGWDVEDYRRHARALRPLVDEMADYYGPGGRFRVGIGTLCRRADLTTICRVASVVADELPAVPLHLWGIKLGAVKGRLALPAAVVSVDSGAWNGLFGRAREEWRASGMRQRQWSHTVALPRYMAAFRAATERDEARQLVLAL